MFFWNSLAFSMIQRMLAVWSLVPLPFLNPAWTSGNVLCTGGSKVPALGSCFPLQPLSPSFPWPHLVTSVSNSVHLLFTQYDLFPSKHSRPLERLLDYPPALLHPELICKLTSSSLEGTLHSCLLLRVSCVSLQWTGTRFIPPEFLKGHVNLSLAFFFFFFFRGSFSWEYLGLSFSLMCPSEPFPLEYSAYLTSLPASVC